MARPWSLLTGKPMDTARWSANWDDNLGGAPEYGPEDPIVQRMRADAVSAAGVADVSEKVRFAFEQAFMFYLPRICERCLNPACVASCPSGALYKRAEDGIVLVGQDRCRGWRQRVTACPYKKVYFNHRTGKAEKCTFCYPRVEVGLPTVCSETCPGRLRYLGVMLYDADRVADAARTEDDRDLYEAQLGLFLDPADPAVARAAEAAGIPHDWIEAAKRSPVRKLICDYRVALPLHPEFRTLPMVWYIPPLSPVVEAVAESGHDGEDAGNLFGAIDALRIPVEYLAELFTAGDVVPVRAALGRLAAMREYIAVATLISGLIWRYRYDKFGWTTRSSQSYESKLLNIASPTFHYGILFVLVGHLMGLFVPASWTDAVGFDEHWYNLLSLFAGTAAGVLAVAGIGMLIHRRRTTPAVFRATTRNDKLMYVVLFAAIIMGLIAKLSHAGIHDPLYRIRVLALFACAAVPGPETDAAILDTLDDAPVEWRRTVTRAVAVAKHTGLADRLAESYRDRIGESATARLLTTCSADVAARLLPGLVHEVRNWGQIGAWHPELMLDFARRELAAMPPGSREPWWGREFAHGLASAAVHLPVQVLDLLEDFPLPQGLPHSFLRRIHPLIRADEDRTLRLLTVADGRLADRWQHLSRSTRKRLAHSGRPEIVAVGRAVRDRPAALADLLRCLPPGERAAFYDAVTADQEQDTAMLAPAVLDALPRARRHAEARRMLLLGRLTDRPAQRLNVIARLPWDEAGELRTAVRRSDAQERTAAYPLLVACAAAEDRPPIVSGLLTGELGRLRNEQDPVRRAALAALADVPARLFEDTRAVAEALGRLVTDAVEARDCSWGTRDALRRLASRVLAHQAIDGSGPASGSGQGSASQDSNSLADSNPDSGSSLPSSLLAWSLAAFEQLAGSTGAVHLDRLDRNLRRGQEFAVYRALEPWVGRGMERADHRLVLALGQALGKRAWAIAELQAAFEHAIRNGTAATAQSAIALWLDDPAHRDVRVAEVLADDPTAVAVDPVPMVLSRRRTDLLDPYLSGKKTAKGKFLAKGAVWVPRFQPSHRWLPRQLAAYAQLLGRIAADRGARVHERVAAIRGLGRVPGAGHAEVVLYLDSAETPSPRRRSERSPAAKTPQPPCRYCWATPTATAPASPSTPPAAPPASPAPPPRRRHYARSRCPLQRR